VSSFAPAADRAACCVIQVMKTMHEEMEARVDGAGDDVAADMEKEVHAIGSCLKVRIVLRAFHPRSSSEISHSMLSTCVCGVRTTDCLHHLRCGWNRTTSTSVRRTRIQHVFRYMLARVSHIRQSRLPSHVAVRSCWRNTGLQDLYGNAMVNFTGASAPTL